MAEFNIFSTAHSPLQSCSQRAPTAAQKGREMRLCWLLNGAVGAQATQRDGAGDGVLGVEAKVVGSRP